MNSINLIFQNGHFYNKDTKKRVLFIEGKEFCIVADNNTFKEAQFAGRRPKQSLSSEALLIKLQNRKPAIEFRKICERGDFLFFIIHTDKRYTFKVELDEDLYLIKGNKAEYKLYDCQCRATENVENHLDFFEPVYGKSLSDLRKCTYVHYFGNKGNPSANAITDFYLADMKTTIDDLRKKQA